MSWFRIDDGSAFNEKVVAAGNEAWGAFCRVGAWCSQQLSDGRFSRAIAVTIAPMRVWTKLIDVGLVDDLERGEMLVHDYLQRNPSKEQVLRERATTKARVTDLRNGRRTTPCTPVQPPPVTVGETRLPSHPIPSHPEKPQRGEPRSETRLKSVPPPPMAEPRPLVDQLAQAYASGVAEGSGEPWRMPDAGAESAVILDGVTGHKPNLRGDALLEWVKRSAATYRRMMGDKAEYQRGFRPSKWVEWLNSGGEKMQRQVRAGAPLVQRTEEIPDWAPKTKAAGDGR